MKIVCDNCGAKYSIADEKVAGKVFKIRCKKCSDVIVVRGDQVAPDEDEQTRVFDYGGEAVWHVVVNGEQQGPYAPLQVGSLLNDGTIDWEAYVWREGYDGWKAIRDVSELADLLGGAAPAPGAEPAADGAEDYAQSAAPAEPKADLFASNADDDFAGVGGSAPESAPGGDLFATPAASASPFGGVGAATNDDDDDDDDQDVVASQPSPRVSTQQSMTGQRNENSVLFSLTNLQALATGNEASSPAPSPMASAPSPASHQGSMAGMASGEGSGLIDIRALASAASSPRAASSSSSGGGGSTVDDLLSIGTGAGGFGASLGSPMLAPVAVEQESSGANVKVLYGMVGLLALGLIGAVVFVITREPQQIVVTQEVPAAAAAAGSDSTNTAAAEPTTVVQPGAAAPSEAAPAPEPSGSEPESSRSAAAERRDRDRERAASSRTATAATTTSSPMAAAASPTPAPAREAATMERARGGDSLDALMGEVVGMSAMAETSMASNLPDQPSRGDVRTALSSVQGRVSACGSDATAMAAVTFSGSTGRVSSVNVTGVPGPVASCVSTAVRGASVPPFSRPTFNVTFPYRL